MMWRTLALWLVLIGAVDVICLTAVPAQSYRDVVACTLTSNPPIAGRMVDGVCKPFVVSGSTSQLIGDIMVSPAPTKCPAGTEKVLVPGGVKCARGLVDPE